ncbi:MAG: DUF2513 domain-containing protein [Candidatus Sulfotelmatobacter sp.]
MKRDMDLFRELLVKIEENPAMDGTREFSYHSPREMGISGHSIEEVAYHLKLLIEARYVDGAVTLAVPMQVIRGLTNEGHDFLSNIRSDDIWNKVKKQVGDLTGHVGLPVIASLAEAIVRKHYGLT